MGKWIGVVVKGEEELTRDCSGEDCGVSESLRVGQGEIQKGKEDLPSSIEGELDIWSLMSSSISSSSSRSASCMSASSSSPLDGRPLWRSMPIVTVVPSSSEPGSGRRSVPALFQALWRLDSSDERSWSTWRRAASWWGAAGPMPRGAGCSGCSEWSCAVGEDFCCKSCVSAG